MKAVTNLWAYLSLAGRKDITCHYMPHFIVLRRLGKRDRLGLAPPTLNDLAYFFGANNLIIFIKAK